MNDLIFACNVVIPIMLLICLGYILKRLKIVDKHSLNQINKLCFKLFLPVSLFISIYETTSIKEINYQLLLFVSVFIIIIFIVGLLIVKFFIKDERQKGVVLQSFFRSNFAIIGIPLATAIAGAEGTKVAAIVSLALIPLNNIFATISLSLFIKNPEDSNHVKSTVLKIGKNPLVIAVVLGIIFLLIRYLFNLWSFDFRLNQLTFIYQPLKLIAGVTTPLALITAGGLFEFSVINNMKKQVVFSTLSKLVFVPLIVFVIAFLFFDFNGAEYATLVAAFAAPAAVSSAVMAKEMDNDSDLANQILIWSTIFSAITIFLIIYFFRILHIF